ncbi:MAG: amidohydrolase, partial [Clostridiales bacterium]|nr:amidohydrolase [Clostridiales bacterium]
NRYELDAVSGKIPIYIMAFDGHSSLGNSALMKLCGITDDYKESEGEIVERDENGVPNGIFKEGAISNKILRFCPNLYPDDSTAKQSIRECLTELSRLGYTTEHTILGLWPSMLGRARLYQEMAAEHCLPMRLNLCYCDEYENGMNVVSGFGNEWVRLGAVKFFIDGAMSERTAYLSEEYKDQPDWKGCIVWEPEEFEKRVTKAYMLGNDVCIHIIGDAALDIVLDVVEKIARPEYTNSFELIHCAVTRPDQIERMKKLPVIVHKQPIFIKAPATLDGEKRIGELNRYYHSIRSFMDAGITVTGGTDGPLSDMSAMMAIETAVTRVSFDNKTTVNPQECISIYKAVEMFTKNAAYAGHEQDIKGTLNVGKLADMIVLDRNIFDTPKNEIHNIRVEKTYLGGEAQY